MQLCIAFIYYFNPRSHERSDEIAPTVPPVGIYFNPRSHERSDFLQLGQILDFFDFNPRSHERSDKDLKITFVSSGISIHAPTRGATVLLLACNILYRFQSTLPREERLSSYEVKASRGIISIHAPTRGATVLQKSNILYIIISIHAPTRGATFGKLKE